MAGGAGADEPLVATIWVDIDGTAQVRGELFPEVRDAVGRIRPAILGTVVNEALFKHIETLINTSKARGFEVICAFATNRRGAQTFNDSLVRYMELREAGLTAAGARAALEQSTLAYLIRYTTEKGLPFAVMADTFDHTQLDRAGQPIVGGFYNNVLKPIEEDFLKKAETYYVQLKTFQCLYGLGAYHGDDLIALMGDKEFLPDEEVPDEIWPLLQRVRKLNEDEVKYVRMLEERRVYSKADMFQIAKPYLLGRLGIASSSPVINIWFDDYDVAIKTGIWGLIQKELAAGLKISESDCKHLIKAYIDMQDGVQEAKTNFNRILRLLRITQDKFQEMVNKAADKELKDWVLAHICHGLKTHSTHLIHDIYRQLKIRLDERKEGWGSSRLHMFRDASLESKISRLLPDLPDDSLFRLLISDLQRLCDNVFSPGGTQLIPAPPPGSYSFSDDNPVAPGLQEAMTPRARDRSAEAATRAGHTSSADGAASGGLLRRRGSLTGLPALAVDDPAKAAHLAATSADSGTPETVGIGTPFTATPATAGTRPLTSAVATATGARPAFFEPGGLGGPRLTPTPAAAPARPKAAIATSPFALPVTPEGGGLSGPRAAAGKLAPPAVPPPLPGPPPAVKPASTLPARSPFRTGDAGSELVPALSLSSGGSRPILLSAASHSSLLRPFSRVPVPPGPPPGPPPASERVRLVAAKPTASPRVEEWDGSPSAGSFRAGVERALAQLPTFGTATAATAAPPGALLPSMSPMAGSASPPSSRVENPLLVAMAARGGKKPAPPPVAGEPSR